MDAKKSGHYLYFDEEPIVVGKDTGDSDNSEDSGTETEDPDDGVHGGGGSSSGGGGSVTPKPPVDDKPEDVTPSQPVTPVVPATPSYDDVDKDDWYFESVVELSEKGIVSGDGSGKFMPNDNVTREQFLKMIIEAADIETVESENEFNDVLDAWYKPYVLTAKNFGIVNGISDTVFGIGSNITRQDMAVMIARTIEKLGIEIETDNVSEFTDIGIVSDYAKDSVTFMKSIGLIEGYNNEYRPGDNLTRAEAAKVICGLLKSF
ncbi:MAG: S-layer homology domain-containing protein [Clostridia bacterium]|nr:S-layer homology domain-containing protein [Clostridia bacterium]